MRNYICFLVFYRLQLVLLYMITFPSPGGRNKEFSHFLHIHNKYFYNKIIMYKISFIYIRKFEATGSTLACAFGSGVIRLIVVAVSTADTIDNIKGDYVRLIQVIKPHKMAITVMSLNPLCKYEKHYFNKRYFMESFRFVITDFNKLL